MTTTTKNNESAEPVAPHIDLRDWFAGMALQGYVARLGAVDDKDIARYSYQMADAMLAQREKP